LQNELGVKWVTPTIMVPLGDFSIGFGGLSNTGKWSLIIT
jgi:hypothetical protein